MSNPPAIKSATEDAFELFHATPIVEYAEKLLFDAGASVEARLALCKSLLWSAFAEGAKYATNRCAASAHGSTKQ